MQPQCNLLVLRENDFIPATNYPRFCLSLCPWCCPWGSPWSGWWWWVVKWSCGGGAKYFLYQTQFWVFSRQFIPRGRSTTIKPKQSKHSVFFLRDHNRKTRLYGLVWGQLNVQLWRNHLTEDDDLEKYVLGLRRTAMNIPRQIEHSGIFYWATVDKLEFTDWSEVQQRFGSGEITIFQ